MFSNTPFVCSQLGGPEVGLDRTVQVGQLGMLLFSEHLLCTRHVLHFSFNILFYFILINVQGEYYTFYCKNKQKQAQRSYKRGPGLLGLKPILGSNLEPQDVCLSPSPSPPLLSSGFLSLFSLPLSLSPSVLLPSVRRSLDNLLCCCHCPYSGVVSVLWC